MGICNETRNKLGSTSTPQHTDPQRHRALSLLGRAEQLQPLVEHPLNRPLCDTQVTGTESFVEPTNAFLPSNVAYSMYCTTEHARSALVELQTCLDDPDGIRRCSCSNSRESSGREMDPGVLPAVVELVGDDAFAVSIREKLDGACGDDTEKRGPKTPK